MKLNRTNIFALAMMTMVAVGCSDDDNQNIPTPEPEPELVNLSVDFEESELAKIAGASVEFTDVRTLGVTTGKLNEQGVLDISLPIGVYNVLIESEIDQTGSVPVKYCATKENLAIESLDQVISLPMFTFPASSVNEGFIISEFFFNGETNSGRMMHPDQYIVIHNSSLVTMYADGLSIATSAQASISDPAPYYSVMAEQNIVPITGFFTIPGEGTDVPVAPGEEIVIAMTATNHSEVEGWENAVDLSGVDFEFYQVNSESDIDNPDVPNLISTDGVWDGSAGLPGGYGAYIHPKGFYAAMIFKLEKGTAESAAAFHAENTTKFTLPDEQIINLTAVPSDMILDGMVSGQTSIVTRTLPENVDMGSFIVPGCHQQKLAVRNMIELDGNKYYQDSNNSTNDFTMLDKQNSFPVGWRNNK